MKIFWSLIVVGLPYFGKITTDQMNLKYLEKLSLKSMPNQHQVESSYILSIKISSWEQFYFVNGLYAGNSNIY